MQHGRKATFEVRVHADRDRQEIVAAPSSRGLEGSGWTGVFQDQPEPGSHQLDMYYGVGQAMPDAVVVAPGAQGWSPVIGAVAVGAAALPAPDVVAPMEPDAPELSLEAGWSPVIGAVPPVAPVVVPMAEPEVPAAPVAMPPVDEVPAAVVFGWSPVIGAAPLAAPEALVPVCARAVPVRLSATSAAVK
ncbi:hypothetical protein ASG03_00860 [Rhizobium sp. Leaf341]|nr:hypothetical protein ASG03_00860 [Rhizobium sp. Leaf341]